MSDDHSDYHCLACAIIGVKRDEGVAMIDDPFYDPEEAVEDAVYRYVRARGFTVNESQTVADTMMEVLKLHLERKP